MRLITYVRNRVDRMLQDICGAMPDFVTVTTPAVAGHELKIAHGLGRVPIGWSVVKGLSGGGDALPAGTIIDFAGSNPPSGYLICDGATYNQADYPSLYAAIGTVYGAGGAGTFRVPDCRRRTCVGSGGAGTGVLGSTVGSVGGAETHTLTVNEMPSHNHAVNDSGHSHGIEVFASTGSSNTVAEGNNSSSGSDSTDSALTGITVGNTGGGQAHNTMQPSLVVTKCIKSSPTASDLGSLTEWTREFIYLKFAVSNTELTLAIF